MLLSTRIILEVYFTFYKTMIKWNVLQILSKYERIVNIQANIQYKQTVISTDSMQLINPSH